MPSNRREFLMQGALLPLVLSQLVNEHAEAQEHPHEFADIVPLESIVQDGTNILELLKQDFSGRAIDGRNVNLEESMRDNKVVLLSYLAEWCANCGYEAPVLSGLYNTYHAKGLEIIGRSEYSHPDKVAAFAGKFGIEYPIIRGSLNPGNEELGGISDQKLRENTGHYRIRKALGDPRKWGTPFNILILNNGNSYDFFFCLGEFYPAKLEGFLQTHLR